MLRALLVSHHRHINNSAHNNTNNRLNQAGQGTDMKLSDSDRWLPETAIDRLGLEGEDLASYQHFWDRAAQLDAVRAISDQDSDESFETSGITDAEGLVPFLPPDCRFLEIGCGIGRVLQHLTSRCREVHGVDISAEMVKRGQERLAHLLNVHFHHGNGYDLELFGDASFDVCYCAFAFQHMPKPIVFNYLLEIHRVLRPGGVLRFQVPNILRDDQFTAFQYFTRPYFVQHPYPMHFYTQFEVVQLATKAGFWVEWISEDIVVVARKQDQPGVAAGVPHQGRYLELQDRNAELSDQVASLTEALDGFRRHPVIRAARAARDLVRPRTRTGSRKG
jgi:ubiquinone/menaquinone biosynthesis C-methylase UbiE